MLQSLSSPCDLHAEISWRTVLCRTERPAKGEVQRGDAKAGRPSIGVDFGDALCIFSVGNFGDALCIFSFGRSHSKRFSPVNEKYDLN